MKKSLIALAVSLVATGAYANDHQEHQGKSGDNVQIYGLIDEGYTKVEQKITGGHPEVTLDNKAGIKANTSKQSRIGLRGVEHLGAGSRAGFVFEAGIDPNQDKTPLYVRQGYVSLENDSFGKLAIGRQETFTHSAILGSTYGVTNLPGNLAFNRVGGLDRGNVVSYGLSGEYFTISGAYGTQTHNEPAAIKINKDDLKVYELGAGLKYKGFGLKAAYIDATRGFAGNIEGVKGYNAGAKTYLAGADYDFGFLKLGYAYYRADIEGVNVSEGIIDGLHSDRVTIDFNGKTKVHQLAFTAPITNVVEVFGSYVLLDKSGTSLFPLSTENVTKVVQAGSASGNGFQLGTRYHFSKRTSIYGAYGQQVLNGSNNASVKDYGYTVGLRHQF